MEIGNFYRLIGDNRILFLQICLLNSSPHFIRLLLELLNLIGCRGNINSYTPNFEKVVGAYCFWSVRAWVRVWVRACVTLFVPTLTFKLLKLES